MTIVKTIFLMMALALAAFGGGKSNDAPQYTFIKKEKGVSLYYRWIVVENKLKVRELKAEFAVTSTPDKIIGVLKNETVATQWMKGTSEVNRLGNPTGNTWHSYIEYDIPWPLSNQDCIVQYELRREVSSNNYFITMKGLPKYIPEKKGVTRIQHLIGTWTLSPVNGKSCRVVYTIYSGQAPSFPRWITDPIIQGNLINTMDAFRTLVEKS
jgi:hypothetical protein